MLRTYGNENVCRRGSGCIGVVFMWDGIIGCVFLWLGVYDVDLHGKHLE